MGKRSPEAEKEGIEEKYVLLSIKVMWKLVLGLCNQAKEERRSDFVVLHDVLAIKVSITPEDPIG